MKAWLKKYGVTVLFLGVLRPWVSWPLAWLLAFAIGYGVGRLARLVADLLWGG